MDTVRAERIEAGVDRIAAALLAGATAYAFYGSMSGVYGEPQLGAVSAAAAGVAFLLCILGLRSIPVEERFDLPAFGVPAVDVPAIEPIDELVLKHIDEFRIIESQPADELFLTDADRLQPLEAADLGELQLTAFDRLHSLERDASDELVLEDILAELGPESRVVRLFDPAAMPTPRQLNARIERHLGEESGSTAPPDASQALYDALAELRRSLG
jgi:hypothetical protein